MTRRKTQNFFGFNPNKREIIHSKNTLFFKLVIENLKKRQFFIQFSPEAPNDRRPYAIP